MIPYTPNTIETQTVAIVMALNWTREPSRRNHGICLIHDGIHYNALRLRDNQEEEIKQNEESNNREGHNKTQQRRTKEQDTNMIKNTPLWKRTHTKKGMRCELHTRPAGAFWLAYTG